MAFFEVLISKLGAVNGFSTRSVPFREVSTLNHEVGDHTVKDAPLEVKGLARISYTFLSSTERSEVLCCFGNNIAEKLHHNSAQARAIHGDVEEHSRSRHPFRSTNLDLFFSNFLLKWMRKSVWNGDGREAFAVHSDLSFSERLFQMLQVHHSFFELYWEGKPFLIAQQGRLSGRIATRFKWAPIFHQSICHYFRFSDHHFALQYIFAQKSNKKQLCNCVCTYFVSTPSPPPLPPLSPPHLPPPPPSHLLFHGKKHQVEMRTRFCAWSLSGNLLPKEEENEPLREQFARLGGEWG